MYSNRRQQTGRLALLIGICLLVGGESVGQPPTPEVAPQPLSGGERPAEARPAQPAPSESAQSQKAPRSTPRSAEQGSKPESREAAPDKPAEQNDSQPAAGAEDSSGASPAKDEGELPRAARPAPTWGNEIQAVVSKKHPETVDDLRAIQSQVRQVVAFARPATVGVRVGGSVGSAVIVTPDGLVLTAGHVAMKPNKRVTFFFPDGRRARGITLGVNNSVDSGMMKITDKGPWPYVPMAPAGATTEGDWVVGLGQPNGFFKDRAPPVRLGRILFGDDSALCTDVTLVGGDSGGPLINLRGQVVGIHSRIGRRIVSNFHVPIEQYHATWDRLASAQAWGGRLGASEPVRRRPWLGVAGNALLGRCEITQVFPNAAADRAGLKVGDIIKRFGDEDVDSFRDLTILVNSRRPLSKVKIEVERAGELLTMEVRLGVMGIGFPGSSPMQEDSDS